MIANLRMVSSLRIDGNMSYFHEPRMEVFDRRFDFSFKNNLSLFTENNWPISAHGFAQLLAESGKILVINKENCHDYNGIGISDKSLIPCDAVIVANHFGFPIVLPNADCYPVVIFDQKKTIFSVVHVSREMALFNLIGNCVGAMRNEFDCQADELIAFVFPGICEKCYLMEKLEFDVPKYLENTVTINNHCLFSVDLKRMIIRQLLRFGIQCIFFPQGKQECTCHTMTSIDCDPMYFSNYRQSHKYRFPGCKDYFGNNALFVEMTK